MSWIDIVLKNKIIGILNYNISLYIDAVYTNIFDTEN